MTSIQELLAKIPPIMSVSIDCQNKNPMLYPLRDAVFMLQLTTYWWKDAVKDLEGNTSENVELIESAEDKIKVAIPTLIGAGEQLDYIKKGLAELGKETHEYMNTVSLPILAQHHLVQGYNKVMDALYSTEISKFYHEQYKTRA